MLNKLISFIFITVMTMLMAASAFAVDAVLEAPGQGIFDMIFKALSSAEGASIAIALGLEVLLRVVPSKKPLGILIAVASVCENLGIAFSRFAKFLHGVLPQNIKE